MAPCARPEDGGHQALKGPVTTCLGTWPAKLWVLVQSPCSALVSKLWVCQGFIRIRSSGSPFGLAAPRRGTTCGL